MIRRTHENVPTPRASGASSAGGTGSRGGEGYRGARRFAKTSPEDRARLLEEFIHPDLLPLRRAAFEAGASIERAIADEGVPLDSLLRRWGGAPIPSWRRRCPEGLPMLLESFVRITRLLHELKGAGWIVTRLHPRWLRLGVDGRVRLSADDLLEGGTTISRDEWAPYLAPELLLATGERVASGEEAGVYSLAAILHHSLAGAPPWSGRSETEVADRLLAGASPTPIPVEKDLPSGVAPLLVDALSLDPRRRPSRFRGFAAALESAARGERPRSTPARLRGEPARPRSLLRIGTLLLVAVLVTLALRSSATVRERGDLLGRLDAATTARPFPVHGEDPPFHPAGVQVLRDLGEEAARWGRDPEVQVALGWVQLRAGKAREATESFLVARAWDPESVAASIALGIARLENGDRSGLADLERGFAGEVRTASDRLSRGIGFLYLHRFAEAREAFRIVLETDGPSSNAWFHRALAAHFDGASEEAATALAEARRLQPRDVWTEWLEVERLIGGGKTTEGIERIESRQSEWLESEPLMLRAAVLLKRIGQEERAQKWWERTEFSAAGPLDRDAVQWTARGLLIFPDRLHLELPE